MKSHIPVDARFDFGPIQNACVHGDLSAMDAQLEGELESQNKFGIYQADKAGEMFNKRNVGYLAGISKSPGAVLALKNGHAFVDGGLTVFGKDDQIERNFMCLYVYAGNDKVFDWVNGYINFDLYEYIERLKKHNHGLRFDKVLTYGQAWSDKSAALFQWLSMRK